MPNIGGTPTSNNGDEDFGESADDDEENMTIDRTETPIEGSRAFAPNDTNGNISDQIIAPEFDDGAPLRNLTIPRRYCGIQVCFYWYWFLSIVMGLSIGHSLYWFISVLIVLGMRGIAAILSSEWTSDNRFRISLDGNTQPWPTIYTPGLNQDGLRIAHPSDSLLALMDTYRFSTTITEYLPPPRESEGIEDTQPSTMPISPVLNINVVINDQDSRVNMDRAERANLNQMVPTTMQNSNLYIGADIQANLTDNGVAEPPDEILEDMDISISSADEQLVEDGSDDDVRRLHLENTDILPDNRSTDINVENGQTSINTETITDTTQHSTPSNQTDLDGEQAIAATSTIDPPSPQATERERNVIVSTDDGAQAILPDTNPTVIHVPKLPTPVDSSDESGEETMA